MRCTQCGRELRMGEDIVGVQAGVVGPRGFVPVEEIQPFCQDCQPGDDDEPDAKVETRKRRLP